MVIFLMIKEGIMELLYEHMGTFRTEVVAMVGAHSLTFQEFHACGDPKFFGKKDPNASRRWLADIGNAFQTSFCPKGSNVRFESCLLKDITRD